MTRILFVSLLIFWSASSLAREVEFSWDPLEGAIKYDIQVTEAEDNGFKKPLVKEEIEKPAYNAQLNIGHYIYRVRVIDKKGKPGRWSQPAPITVVPYPPELDTPATGLEVAFYEVQPSLEFKWKPIEGNPKYQILVYKNTGEKVLEDSTTNPSYTTDKFVEGEYLWKVRTVTNKIFISAYSEPRHFSIVRKPLVAPELLHPGKEALAPAYRPLNFSWKQDVNTHFTDLYFERLTSRTSAKPYKAKVLNITGSSYIANYEDPGTYRWSVTTKEARDTPGITSTTQDFDVRDDLISAGAYELEFSTSYVDDLYTTTSTLQSTSGNFIAQQTQSSGIFVGFSGGYYFNDAFGLYLSTRTGRFGVETVNSYLQETDATMRLRFGVKGFFQEFWLGYRIMDIVMAENNPTSQATDFTALGPLIGTRLGATISPGLKAQFTIFYYKPTSTMEGLSGLTADVPGGSLSLKWNFMYQFWLGYKFAVERINASYVPPGGAPGINASWTQYRTEPFFISVSYDHF